MTYSKLYSWIRPCLELHDQGNNSLRKFKFTNEKETHDLFKCYLHHRLYFEWIIWHNPKHNQCNLSNLGLWYHTLISEYKHNEMKSMEYTAVEINRISNLGL